MSSPVKFFNSAQASRLLRSPLVASRSFAVPRLLLVLMGCLMLSGCGFEPLYGEKPAGSVATAVRGNIIIDPINGGHEGQILKIALENKFNPESLDASNAQYHLSISIAKNRIPTVVKSDGTIQRYDTRFDSQFKLFKFAEDKPILTGSLIRTGSYNVAVNANFATYEAEQDVIERTLKEMAEDYVLRVSGYLTSKDPK